MSKLSKKLATIVTAFALVSAQVQPVGAIYLSGGSSIPGQMTSQQAYDGRWRMPGNQTPFPGNSSQPNNKTPFPGSSSQSGNQTPFPINSDRPDNKTPFPSNSAQPDNQTPFPGEVNFDQGNKTPFPGGVSFDKGNKTPFPSGVNFDQGNKTPFPGGVSFDKGNKTPFPSSPGFDGGNKTPFPSNPQRPDNKTPFPSNPQQPDNKTPFPTQPGQMNPGYYYCQEVSTDDIIFVKIITGNDTYKIYFYSKNGELIEVKEVNETPGMAPLMDYAQTEVYNCQSISKELFDLYVFRSFPDDPIPNKEAICHKTESNTNPYIYLLVDENSHNNHNGDIIPIWDVNNDGDTDYKDCDEFNDDDDDEVRVPVCVANYLNGPQYIYSLYQVLPNDLESYYREKNIIGVWDYNNDGEIDTDDCYAIEGYGDDDNPPHRTKDISLCENRPYPRDIDGHWGEIYIRRLFDLCIVEGYENGYFKPNQHVTRAELVKMGLFANGIKPNKGCYDRDCGSPFIDLDDWQGRWVRTAWDRGIVDGYGYNEFRPNQAITRAEAVKIVLATYGYSPLNVENSFFNDVDGWSKGWIERAHELGIVQGIGNGNFDPDRYITRAEAAKIIAKMIEHWDTSVREDNRGRDDYEGKLIPYYCDDLGDRYDSRYDDCYDYYNDRQYINEYYWDERGYYCDADQNRFDEYGNNIGYCYNY